MIASGSYTTDTVDSDFATGDTEEHYYCDSLSSLPRGRFFVRLPWPVSSVTLEMERIVDDYLNAKPLADQIALSKFMAAVEHDLQAPRSRTTTLDAPWLAVPGADRVIAAEWMARLNGGVR